MRDGYTTGGGLGLGLAGAPALQRVPDPVAARRRHSRHHRPVAMNVTAAAFRSRNQSGGRGQAGGPVAGRAARFPTSAPARPRSSCRSWPRTSPSMRRRRDLLIRAARHANEGARPAGIEILAIDTGPGMPRYRARRARRVSRRPARSGTASARSSARPTPSRSTPSRPARSIAGARLARRPRQRSRATSGTRSARCTSRNRARTSAATTGPGACATAGWPSSSPTASATGWHAHEAAQRRRPVFRADARANRPRA